MVSTVITPRQAAFAAIDGEREYQIHRWSGTPNGGQASVTEFLVYMQVYLTMAMSAVTEEDPKGTADGLEIVRKITAMGVACMEQHGAPRRPGY